MHVNAANSRMDAHHVPSSSSLAVQTLREADARTSHSFYVLSLVTSLQIAERICRRLAGYEVVIVGLLMLLERMSKT